jgi:hypothetical protein
MKQADNPLYRDRGPRRDWTGRELLVLNVVIAATFVWLLATGQFIVAAVFAVLWLIGQALKRGRRSSAG